MRMRAIALLSLLLLTTTLSFTADDSSKLEPIEWLVGDWHATATPPNGAPVQIDNHIYWSETKTAIFFLTKFDGKPHYSGMYAYDTDRKVIGFWYVDSDGNFTQGTVRPDGKRLVQEFTISHGDGTKQMLRSLIDRNAEDSGYHWQVLRGEEVKPLIELEYRRK